MKQEGQKKSVLQPTPKVLVSLRNNKGENNALAVAYCSNCSFAPPMVMVGIVESRYSYQMIKESKSFVVNLPLKSYKETFDYLGSVSRRDEDKFEKMHVQFEEAKCINAPILTDCPVNIECEVVDSIKTGSHEMFVGKVLYVHVDEAYLLEDGKIDFSKMDLL